MKTSQSGIDLIKKFEGFSAKPYVCPAGKMTIGYGHVILPGEFLESVTQETAEALLHNDIEEREVIIKQAVTVDLSQGQFDALVSFVFNVGQGKKGIKSGFVELRDGRPSTMLRLLNAGDYEGAAGQFGEWVYIKDKFGNSQKSKGLIRRRKAERELFQPTNQKELLS